MAKPGGRIGKSPGKPVKNRRGVLPAFRYKDGYTLSASDLGKLGVKIELNHEHDAGVAIILPPEKVAECGRWMLETLEQDTNGLPQQLRSILERLSKQSGFKPTLQRGDKKRIREALKALRKRQRERLGEEERVLRSVSKKDVIPQPDTGPPSSRRASENSCRACSPIETDECRRSTSDLRRLPPGCFSCLNQW
ncbi:MAG: hypothetical protein ACYSYM_03935 [Planctomycetota bacterium]